MVRRLQWSTDGSFMLTPASQYKDFSNEGSPSYTVYGFIKSDLTQPSFMLPGIKSYATCIKFNSYLYKKKFQSYPEDNPPIIDLPYRIVFAIATINQVLIYSTESIYPISAVGNLHYSTINDLSWNDNKQLAVCSTDGYISFINFEGEGENNLIGERLPHNQLPEKLRFIYESLE